jgi:hypothetical protein
MSCIKGGLDRKKTMASGQSPRTDPIERPTKGAGHAAAANALLEGLKSVTRRTGERKGSSKPRLLIEVAHKSLHKHGEELGGDWVKISTTDTYFIAVLSDGLGSGVKANIMATLTAEIGATMLQQGAQIEDVIETLAATLPECKIRRLAYATFSILQVRNGRDAYLVEYDAPPMFFIRNGKVQPLPMEERTVHQRRIRECQFTLEEGDCMVMVSDGYIHAGVGHTLKLGWGWENIAHAIEERIETKPDTWQLLNYLTYLCNKLYEGKPGDDATALVMWARRAISATVWSGPPADKGLDQAALDRLMQESGTRVICGGTTAQVASRLIGTPIKVLWNVKAMMAEASSEEKIPPIGDLKGVDLVTEGIITISKTIDRLRGATSVYDLPVRQDGATQLARILLGADKIHSIIGDAVNPQQVGDLVRGRPMRQLLLDELMNDLRARGKVVSAEHL